ncbi:hypothetical protein K438DRAFT_1811194 [Mycena galopus ATCC 62051]|nr:hypothetical protein K438DRAFT_1811194 [Mycena galopus ATCC 62051]
MVDARCLVCISTYSASTTTGTSEPLKASVHLIHYPCTSRSKAPACEKLTTDMVRFNAAHAIYDPEFRPPTFRRESSSQSDATAPIHITAKRKKGREIELRSTKRRKEEAAAASNPGRKPTRKKPSRVSAAPASKSVQVARRSKR